VSVVVYTKWPEMTEDRVISDLRDKQLIVTLYVKQSVYTVHIGKLRYTICQTVGLHSTYR